MRRFPLVLGATAAGLGAVLTYHSRAGETALPPAAQASTGAGHTGTTAPRRQPGTATTGPTTGATTAPAPTSTTTTNPPAHQSATGALQQYGYGVLSVRVTASGSKITDVSVAKLQTADAYSQTLANQVIPYLRHEVLAKQTARIYGISGATYTSEAYAASVQSALDKLHLP